MYFLLSKSKRKVFQFHDQRGRKTVYKDLQSGLALTAYWVQQLGYGLDSSGFEFWQKQKFYLLQNATLALGPIKPSI
jgi:hypothetical protein